MSQVSYKQDLVARARRVVVKVGSAVISDAGGLRPKIIVVPSQLGNLVVPFLSGGFALLCHRLDQLSHLLKHSRGTNVRPTLSGVDKNDGFYRLPC